MTVIRRALTRSPEVAAKSKIGDMLANRREGRLAARKVAYTETKAPKKRGVGEVIRIHEEETPFTDALSRARYETRPHRGGEYVHVSDLIGKCIRKIALVERYDLVMPTQQLSLTDSLTFKQGDAIHDVLKERAARGAPRSVWGNWECRCKTFHTEAPCLAEEVSDEKCPACGTTRDLYKEVPMLNEEYMIVGTPDMVQYLTEYDCFYVDELKSIAHEKWKELVRPIPEHVIQVLFYWWLMNQKGYKMADRASVIYATKGWLFSGSPAKEFSFSPPEMLKRLEPYLEAAAALKASRDGGKLPAPDCPSPEAPAAKKCEACSVCFKGSDEAPKKISASEALGRRR